MAEGLMEEVGEAVIDVGKEVTTWSTAALVTGTVVGVAVGAGVAYFVTKKRVKSKYDVVLVEEISKARKYYEAKKSAMEEQYKQPLNEVMADLGYKEQKREYTPEELEAIRQANEKAEAEEATPKPPVSVPPRPEFVHRADPGIPHDFRDVWDFAVEHKKRKANPDRPYVIHADEHGDQGYETDSYTYYMRDQVLTDSKDEVIENVDVIVGFESLQQFGHGSQNPGLVLVRNDGLSLDIDITRLDLAYSEISSAGLKHSENREKIMRRGRRFDDEE